MKILLGSTSPLKLAALKEAITYAQAHQIFEGEIVVETAEVASSVPETPTEAETYLGAKNRAIALTKKYQADLYLGVESGLVKKQGHLFEECYCVIINGEGQEWIGVSSAIQIPGFVLELIKTKGNHIDAVNFSADKAGRNRSDTWGLYSDGRLSRTTSVFEACRNALLSYFVEQEQAA